MVKKLKLEELHRIDVETFKESEKTPVVVVLDDIRSRNNVGAVFRSADAFILKKIVLCGITPVPPHRDIQKAALGATESVDWEYEKDITDALKKLKDQGYLIYAIEQTTESVELQNFQILKDEKYALIMGNEVDGVSYDALGYCDGFIEVPQQGTKHSLNISVCAGLVMWEFFKKIGIK